MLRDNLYDVAIVGGGAMGTATAWALAKRGIKPLVLEQYQHVNELASHSGETRIIRQAYAESPEYVPLVQRADQLWQELEVETGQEVLVRCGGLELAAPGFRHARAARASADQHGLDYEWLTPAEVNARWPAIRMPEGWDALFSATSGFLLTEPALKGMGDAARRLGATIQQESQVVDWGRESDRYWVSTPTERYAADALVFTAGAWSSRLLTELGLPLEVRRKTLWWQGVDDPAAYAPERFPVFIADSISGEIYGFPLYGTPGLKIANHQGGETVEPDQANRETVPGENRDCLDLTRTILPGVSERVVKSAVCLYTMTPDTDFIVDRHPGLLNVAFGAGFSGHGFKFAPAVGELLAELITDDRVSPLPRLRIARFA